MANTPPHLLAKGTIRPARFVRMDGATSHGALEGNANSRIIGISQPGTRDAPIPNASLNAAEDGEPIRIFGDGEECLLEVVANTAVASGDLLKSDADGLGEPIDPAATTVQEHGARALDDVDAVPAESPFIRVQVTTGGIRPVLI